MPVVKELKMKETRKAADLKFVLKTIVVIKMITVYKAILM